jgi:hypothetical protein
MGPPGNSQKKDLHATTRPLRYTFKDDTSTSEGANDLSGLAGCGVADLSSTATGECPERTTLIPAITESWSNGKKTSITLCAIDGTSRTKPIVEKEFKKKIYNGLAANNINQIALSSEAAAAFVKMMDRAKQDKVKLNATFSYRSYNEQKAIRGVCKKSGRCGSGDARTLDANGKLTSNILPGNYNSNRASAGYSNHQTGLSLDVDSTSLKWIKKCISGGKSYDNADDGRCFGFYFDVPGDDPHLTYKPKK